MGNCMRVTRGVFGAGTVHSGLTPLGRDDSAAIAAVESVLSKSRVSILLMVVGCDVV